MSTSLPNAIVQFIRATNEGDIDAVGQTLHPEVVIEDKADRAVYSGATIRDFLTQEGYIGGGIRLGLDDYYPIDIEHILRFEVTGKTDAYRDQPYIFRFHFILTDGLISSLRIFLVSSKTIPA